MSEFVHFLSGLCLPAKIYLTLTIVNFFGLLLVRKVKVSSLTITAFIVTLIIGLGITWFGNYLCSNGFEIVTWLIVLLPFLGFLRNLYDLSSK